MKGKVAIVTGTSTGLGHALACALSDAGADKERSAEILGRIPYEKCCKPLDLSGAVVFVVSKDYECLKGYTLAVYWGLTR